MQAAAQPNKIVRGEYTVEHLRPDPAQMEQFMPLWNARNAVIAWRDAVLERMDRMQVTLRSEAAPFALHAPAKALLGWIEALRLDSPAIVKENAAWLQAQQELDDLVVEEQRLTVAMRPYQQRVGEIETFPNLVTNVGKNDILDKYLKGSSYTQTIVMGLKGAGTAAVGDTQASHGGWTERGGTNAPAYTGNRKAVTMGSASSQVSTSPTQAFAITSSGTVDGCFINNGGSATKDDTTGVLFSAGDFTGGSKTVANLDTLNVVYTLTAS